MLRIYSLLLLAFLFVQTAAAQSGSIQLRALKENGVLLVALPTRSKKTEALQRALEDPTLTVEETQNINARLEGVRTDNERDAQLLRQAFAAAYTFSDYRFTYDTVVVSMRNGKKPAYLLDDMLADVATTWPKDQPYWVVQLAEQRSMKGLHVRTAALQPIPASVEDFYRLNSVASFFRALTQPKAAAELIDAQRMVARLNKGFARTQLP